MGAVVTMRRAKARAPEAYPEYASLSSEAKAAFASLKAVVGRAERIFSGSFTTATQKAELDRLMAEVRIGATAVGRLSK